MTRATLRGLALLSSEMTRTRNFQDRMDSVGRQVAAPVPDPHRHVALEFGITHTRNPSTNYSIASLTPPVLRTVRRMGHDNARELHQATHSIDNPLRSSSLDAWIQYVLELAATRTQRILDPS